MATRTSFLGFSVGEQVEISVDGETGATGPDGWNVIPGNDGVSATIEIKRSALQVAPEGINFKVALEGFDTPGPVARTGTYDPRFHEIYYFWEFGDPGATFTAPEHTLTEHRDANKGYGPLASHTFSAPGTYTVSCLVIEPASGKTATATLDVTVGDADEQFFGTRTIFVDPDGDFSGAPSGAQLFSDMQAAFARAGQTASPTDYYRIMARGGKQYNLAGAQMRNGYKNLWICSAPGTGTAELLCAKFGGQAVLEDRCDWDGTGKRTDFVFHDINLTGEWDSTLEGNPSTKDNFLWHSEKRATYVLFHNVYASGFDTFWATNAVDQPNLNTVQVMNNCTITNWGNFGIYMDFFHSFGLTGNRITQHVQARSGGAKGRAHNEHGPIRLQTCRDLALDACDLFSRNGWFPNALGMHTVQPCLRWAQVTSPAGRLNMQRCFAEGPGQTLYAAPQDAGQSGSDQNMVVDKCHLTGGIWSGSVVECQQGGLTLRNSVVTLPNSQRNGTYGAFNMNSFIRFVRDDRNNEPLSKDVPQRIYNNTFINHSTEANSIVPAAQPIFASAGYGSNGAANADSAFSDIVEANNILHQPNVAVPQVAFAPLDLTVLHAARYADYRDQGHPIVTTLPNSVANGGTVSFPYTLWGAGRVRADFLESSSDARLQHEVFQVNGTGATFAFGATEVTITNNSGGTWANGAAITINLARSAIHIRPEYGTPSNTIVRGAPLAGSPALGAALLEPVALDDMLGNLRPAYPSIGAREL